jgi:hypothetical protein
MPRSDEQLCEWASWEKDSRVKTEIAAPALEDVAGATTEFETELPFGTGSCPFIRDIHQRFGGDYSLFTATSRSD